MNCKLCSAPDHANLRQRRFGQGAWIVCTDCVSDEDVARLTTLEAENAALRSIQESPKLPCRCACGAFSHGTPPVTG